MIINQDLLEGYAPMEGLNQETPRILSIEELTDPSPFVRIFGCFGDGSDPQFGIFLPPKEQWKGRFIQKTHPFITLYADNFDLDSDDLAFFFNYGGYTITVPKGTSSGIVVQASAAHVSRTIAKNYYGYDEKIYGYLFGGSGGSMQTIGALELRIGLVWDGAVPFIIAEPASLGNYDIRIFARAVLEEKAPLIADAVRPGGSGDPFAMLTALERDILNEVTKLGVPLEGWETYESLLMLNENAELIDAINARGEVNETYTNAFWNEAGYLEAYDPELRDLFYNLRDRGASEGSLAKMVYHRHKDPGPTFRTRDHLRDLGGDPIFAQTEGTHYAIEAAVAVSGGAKWNGNINYKTIAVVNLKDVDAFPSDGHYYRERVIESGREGDFRIWLNENANHNKANAHIIPDLDIQLINYYGILQQAILDLIAWVEKGIEPPKSTSYNVVDSQLIVEDIGAERGGIQPIVKLTVNDAVSTSITSGGSVDLSAIIQVPQGTGEIVSVEWDFLGDGGFIDTDFDLLPDGSWAANAIFTYNETGTYLPQVRVASHRDGDPATPFARIYNLGRARVIVE